MHMADALLSPAVGGALWAVSAATIAYSSRKVSRELDDRQVPLMGVLGAFLFAAQMINFTIPATGSSGHLGGGLLLAILLGPHAAYLTIASVLVVQALLFADGGLLALGCNIFNMGFIPACVVYPLVYRNFAGAHPGQTRQVTATLLAAIIGLQLGPLGVVLETFFSGISALPFSTFLLLMQPIHLAIGFVEGIVTVAVLSFVYKARPEMLYSAREPRPVGTRPFRTVLVSFLAAAFLTAGILSWFASSNPDGLEWAIAKVTGQEELKAPRQGLRGALASLQEATAFLPDYSFRKPAEPLKDAVLNREATKASGEPKKDGVNRFATSVSGVVGASLTLSLVFLCGFVLKRRGQSV